MDAADEEGLDLVGAEVQARQALDAVREEDGVVVQAQGVDAAGGADIGDGIGRGGSPIVGGGKNKGIATPSLIRAARPL